MLGLSLLYVDERVRHEGYDIEWLIGDAVFHERHRTGGVGVDRAGGDLHELVGSAEAIAGDAADSGALEQFPKIGRFDDRMPVGAVVRRPSRP